MKFAVNALIWTTEFDHRSFSLLPRLRQHGFDGFEVPVFHPAAIQRSRSVELWRRTNWNALSARSFPRA